MFHDGRPSALPDAQCRTDCRAKHILEPVSAPNDLPAQLAAVGRSSIKRRCVHRGQACSHPLRPGTGRRCRRSPRCHAGAPPCGPCTREAFGKLSDIIHATAIALALPQILKPGETLIRPSLAAGKSPDRLFDLESNCALPSSSSRAGIGTMAVVSSRPSRTWCDLPPTRLVARPNSTFGGAVHSLGSRAPAPRCVSSFGATGTSWPLSRMSSATQISPHLFAAGGPY